MEPHRHSSSYATGRSGRSLGLARNNGPVEDHRSRAIPFAGVLASFIVLALLAGACGGSSSAAKVASLGKATSTTASQAPAPSSGSSSALVQESVAYAQCMRKHGEPDFPDPDSAGSFPLAALASLDPNSPQFGAALKACQGLRPKPSAQNLTQDNTALLKFSACMRSHGELSFPDFDLGSGRAAQVARQYLKTIDPSSPQFQSAFRACLPLLPPIIGAAIGS